MGGIFYEVHQNCFSPYPSLVPILDGSNCSSQGNKKFRGNEGEDQPWLLSPQDEHGTDRGSGQPGIDLEDDLGLDRDLALARLDGYYRLGRKHRLQFGYFTFKRDAVRTIDRDIIFGDITFQLNAQIESEFKNSITQIGYMYSLRQTDRFEVAGTFGIHWMDVQSKLRGNTVGGVIETSSTDAAGPLPLIGIDIDYAFTPRLIASLRGMLRGSLEYFFMNNLGVGLGVNRFDLDLTYSDNNRGADFTWGYDGLQLYLTARL
jgi:hypothetical protein